MHLPRLAIGRTHPAADYPLAAWGLAQVLHEDGYDVQWFISKAIFPTHQVASAVTGKPVRYLDSWLMGRDECVKALLRLPESVDLVVIEAAYPGTFDGGGSGGRLDTLCEWLGLVKIAVLTAAKPVEQQIQQSDMQLDACILEHVADAEQFNALAAQLWNKFGLITVGGIGREQDLVDELKKLPPASRPEANWFRTLGRAFRTYWQPERFWKLIRTRTSPLSLPSEFSFEQLPSAKGCTIAIAFDEAFYCYYHEILEQLEQAGARVLTFSTLRDELLPPGTDLVYIGCGRVDWFAQQLSRNHCIRTALRCFISQNKPVYAEGAGAALMAQQLELPDGSLLPMCGVLPAVARWRPAQSLTVPCELSVVADNWLFQTGTILRAYRHPFWQLEATGQPNEEPMRIVATDEDGHPIVFLRKRVLASMAHVNFAHSHVLLSQLISAARTAKADS